CSSSRWMAIPPACSPCTTNPVVRTPLWAVGSWYPAACRLTTLSGTDFMSTQSALLLLCTETPLHAGTGQSVAGIDLPIQREVHTQWPCVYGSAVKGA